MKKVVVKRRRRVKVLIVSLLTILSLLLISMFIQIYQNVYSKQDVSDLVPIECIKNSDCVIARGSCCSCENGGAPKCIAKINMGDYVQKLELCSRGGTCFNLDCGKISCGCVNNRCVGKPI